MSKSYNQLMKQIGDLQRQAEEIKRKEVGDVVDRIKQAIKAYDLSAADLGFGTASKPRAAKKAGKRAGRKPARTVVKFRDEAGNTWGGRGPRPAWLRTALASGKQLSDFAVK